jgi:hypothetical protein
MRWCAVVLWLASVAALAQESPLHAELRREGERVSEACNFTSNPPRCAATRCLPTTRCKSRPAACPAKWIWPGWRFRVDQEHQELATQLGL